MWPACQGPSPRGLPLTGLRLEDVVPIHLTNQSTARQPAGGEIWNPAAHVSQFMARWDRRAGLFGVASAMRGAEKE
ncbi:hypothetical protein Ssi02_02100 [Sinosporangium siamense]|uniref:Uncharacterized protein n=1 Tax=Sinosporangium siamense TaxID=1367973 RepID=A0A919RDW2_9ACTN|nr:hypothetical protein Ssi02_02100 [Sinosporangium siamense]